MNVFITGVSGYFGSKLVSLFETKDEISAIWGIDLKPPSFTSKKLTFIRHDIRDDIFPLLAGKNIDRLIHAAFILPPLHDKAYMEDININGTKNALNASARAAIPQVLHCSSATAYGFHPDNPPLLTEESPLRGNDDFTYSKNKKELEFVCAEFQKTHPEICLTIIRPCFVVGAGFDNPLSQHLKRKIVILPRKTVPFQFIHEDDLAEIIYRLLIEKRGGIYNLAADGTMTFDEMVSGLGNWCLKLPLPIMYPLNNLMWFLRVSFITKFPSPGLNLVTSSWIASNEKVKKELGYRFRYTTKEAFEDFIRHSR